MMNFTEDLFLSKWSILTRSGRVQQLSEHNFQRKIAEISKITEKNHSCIYMTAQFPDRHSNESVNAKHVTYLQNFCNSKIDLE
jgi:hypothetical protein